MATNQNYYKIKHGLEAPSQDTIQVTDSVYPTTRPSLNLDFAKSKVLDPRIGISRSSTARYYDQSTVAKAEENLLLRSQEMTTSPWSTNGAAVTADAGTAPDGTNTADSLACSTVTTWNLFQSFTPTTGVSYSYSVFAKAGSTNFLQLSASASTSFANFDLSGGTVGTVGSSATASISSVGNGWYRCVMNLATANGLHFYATVIASGSAAFQTSAVGSVLLWGAQLEQRTTATSYTPTTSSRITRHQPQLMTAAVNVARLDHDPITRESLGLLIEEPRSNLVTFSEDLSNGAWIKTNATISTSTAVAPDGTPTGDKLIENTANNAHRAYQVITVSSSTTYTMSFFCKQAERTKVRIRDFNAPVEVNAIFDLSNGTVQSETTAGIAMITNVGNNWFRCAVTLTTGASQTAVWQTIELITGTSTLTYTGDGYSGIFVWGAQFEAGGFATSYISRPDTNTAQRLADIPSMTGANFSSWYRPDEGTVFCIASRYALLPSDRISSLWSISDNTGLEMFYHYNDGAGQSMVALVFDNNVVEGNLGTGGITSANTQLKSAFAYKRNDFAFSLNGNSVSTDTNGTLPIVDRLYLGSGGTGGSPHWSGHIRMFAYYPVRLSNVQLQALTS